MIIIAGASGDLGGRIAKEAIDLGMTVKALVRQETSKAQILKLKSLGCLVHTVDYSDPKSLESACRGGSVVISALSGLRDTIVGTQSQLLKAAVEAQVPRFIPSDFALDFTKIPSEWNRNLSFRSEFLEIADQAKIEVTSILNGGFMDMLTGVAPFILFKARRVLCWGDPNQLMDWTTIDDTAKFTAHAAKDKETPRFLKISGDQVSAKMLVDTMTELTGTKFKLLRPGNLQAFHALIKTIRFISRENQELYPPWQGMQYMHNMYSGKAKLTDLDNDRYAMEWTKTRSLLKEFLKV